MNDVYREKYKTKYILEMAENASKYLISIIILHSYQNFHSFFTTQDAAEGYYAQMFSIQRTVKFITM